MTHNVARYTTNKYFYKMNNCNLKYDNLSNNECTFLFYKKLYTIKNNLININFDQYYQQLVDELLGNLLTIQRGWIKVKKSKKEIYHVTNFIFTFLLEGVKPELFHTNTILLIYFDYVLKDNNLFELAHCYKLFSNTMKLIYNKYILKPIQYNFGHEKYEYCSFDYWVSKQLKHYFFQYYNDYLKSKDRKMKIIWQEWEYYDILFVNYIEWLPKERIEDICELIGEDIRLTFLHYQNHVPFPREIRVSSF